MNKNYQIFTEHIGKLGKGSFGIVYLGLNKDNGELVAIKTESKDGKNLLAHENRIIKLATSKGTIRSMHFWEDNYRYYLATNLLGPSIDSLHKICSRSFSLKTTLMITEQMLGLIKYYHQKDIIHRDIKPANFLINYELPHKNIYLIDFGLAKKFKIRNKLIPLKTGVTRVGSLRYMSKHVHDLIEPSCRDDLYSLGYTMIFLFCGELPWQGHIIADMDKKQKQNAIVKLKKTTPNKELVKNCTCIKCKENNTVCSFHTCMLDYFNYMDTLNYDTPINYNYLIKMIIDCFKSHGFTYDYEWDWNKYYLALNI